MSNPDLIILTHESAAYTPHILQRCANINRNVRYFDSNRAPRATRMYRVQPLRTSFDSAHSDACQIPIYILTHESAAYTPHILQRCANINRNVRYFDSNRAPRATRMYRVQPLRTSFDSAHSDACQIPI